MRAAKDLFFSSSAGGAPVTPPGSASVTPPATMPAATGSTAAIQAHAIHAALAPQQLWRADEVAGAAAGSMLSTGYTDLDAVLPGGGWPQGQLVELLLDSPGIGELSLLAPALARCSSARAVVWVLPCEQKKRQAAALPYAPSLQAAGVELARSIFVQPATPRESCWAIEQSLRAAHLGAVIGWLDAGQGTGGSSSEFRALRRLQLLATQSRALVFMLRSTRSAASPSPAALRLQLNAHDGRLQVHVLKRRGRPLLQPLRLEVHPAHWQHARIAPPAAAEPVELAAPLVEGAMAALQAEQRARRWSMKALFTH